MEELYPTGHTAFHVCLHERKDNQATSIAIGTPDNPIVADVRLAPAELSTLDHLVLAISALADISAIGNAELTPIEKNQLRVILASRIRTLMTQI